MYACKMLCARGSANGNDTYNNTADNPQVKDFYQNQSKHVMNELGTEHDRVRVPVWIDDKLDDKWKHSLREAVGVINEAAPGLSLSITEDKKGAIVHALAIDKEEAYTEGNILMRSGKSDFVAKICLGKEKDDRKKRISIHELLHTLGFYHESQSTTDVDSYEYHLDSGKKITINKNSLRLIRFDCSSTTMYPCEMNKCECQEHLANPVLIWQLKAYPTKENTELDELDMVGLNLVYPPCKDTRDGKAGYNPERGKNGMYYCGREVMRGLTYRDENYTRFCGPDSGPNCPACRTIKSTKVNEILKGGRWQGMTGRVYCGRLFIDPGKIFSTHDGMCGMDNGPACPECREILNKELSASP